MSVQIDTVGDAAIVMMGSPPVNAVNQEIRTGLLDAFDKLAADPSVARIILKGAGTSFAAGRRRQGVRHATRRAASTRCGSCD